MRILLAIDGSRYALGATRFVCDYLAGPGRRVDLLHVLSLEVRADSAPPRQERKGLRVPPLVRSWLDRAERRLRARGFSTARCMRRGVPARVVAEWAASGDYDLVVAGAKGRSGVPFMSLGSVALAVLEQHSPAQVLLVRERKLRKEERIPTPVRPFPALFATDGSARIARVAGSFFRMFSIPRLEPVAVAVAELPDPAALAGLDTEARKQLVSHIQAAAGRWAQEAKSLLARPGVRPQARAVRGSAATAILQEANRRDAQLIVLGSRGVRSAAAPPLGSVALQVARLAPCSVLVVRDR